MPSNLSHSKMRRTPGKLRRIKYPYLTRKKKGVLIFGDKKCWQHRMSQVVFGYERWRWDESWKITFILCMELSLKTSLNPGLCGEQRGVSPPFSHLSYCFFETRTCQNQSLTRALQVSRFARWEPSRRWEAEDVCAALLSNGRVRELRHGREKRIKRKLLPG